MIIIQYLIAAVLYILLSIIFCYSTFVALRANHANEKVCFFHCFLKQKTQNFLIYFYIMFGLWHRPQIMFIEYYIFFNNFFFYWVYNSYGARKESKMDYKTFILISLQLFLLLSKVSLTELICCCWKSYLLQFNYKQLTFFITE
jgi:hypothetical protein